MKNSSISASVSVVTFAWLSTVTLAAPQSSDPVVGDLSVGAFVYDLPIRDFRPDTGDAMASGPTIDASLREAVIARLHARGDHRGEQKKILQGKILVYQTIRNEGAPTDCFMAVEYQVRVGASVIHKFRKESSSRNLDAQIAREAVVERNLSALRGDQAFPAALK